MYALCIRFGNGYLFLQEKDTSIPNSIAHIPIFGKEVGILFDALFIARDYYSKEYANYRYGRVHIICMKTEKVTSLALTREDYLKCKYN